MRASNRTTRGGIVSGTEPSTHPHKRRRAFRRWQVLLLALAVLVPAGTAAAVTHRRGGPMWNASSRHAVWQPAPGRNGPMPYAAPGMASANASPSSVSPSSSAPSKSPSGGSAAWRVSPGTTWQWQIIEKVVQPFHDVNAYDVDLTDAVPQDTEVRVPGIGSVRWPKGQNAGVVDKLHASGRHAICYIATGAWESYEPDASLFPGASGASPNGSVLGNGSGWQGEQWLDVRTSQRDKFAPIMWARFDLAKSIGCDGIHADQNNVASNNPNGPVTLADEKSWYLEVARQAHARGLSIGMANGLEILDSEMVSAFDWALNEECFYYGECSRLDPFIKAGKAVLQIEYVEDWASRGHSSDPATLARSSAVCPQSRSHTFSTLIRHRSPDTQFVAC